MTNEAKPPLSEKTLAFLQQDLPESAVSVTTKEDREIRHITSNMAITLANHAFGIGGWSTNVLAVRPVQNDTGKTIGYAATVRVTIHENGAHYEDVGTNSLDLFSRGHDDHGRPPDEMDAHDRAYKGAVSDAVKRCLRHLGQMMGNNLYEKVQDRIEVANAALDRLEETAGKSVAEDIVFGAKYSRTSEIPLHAGLKALFWNGDHIGERPVDASREPEPATPAADAQDSQSEPQE